MASTAPSRRMVATPRRGHVRLLAALLLVGSIAGCDATNNTPRYPDVHGTYTLEITFDLSVPNFASGGGSVTIVQADGGGPELSGSAAAHTRVAGVDDQWDRLIAASVAEDNTMSFALEGPDTYVEGPLTNRWGFVGSITDDVITGSHGLELNGSLYTGTFRAIRSAQ